MAVVGSGATLGEVPYSHVLSGAVYPAKPPFVIPVKGVTVSDKPIHHCKRLSVSDLAHLGVVDLVSTIRSGEVHRHGYDLVLDNEQSVRRVVVADVICMIDGHLGNTAPSVEQSKPKVRFDYSRRASTAVFYRLINSKRNLASKGSINGSFNFFHDDPGALHISQIAYLIENAEEQADSEHGYNECGESINPIHRVVRFVFACLVFGLVICCCGRAVTFALNHRGIGALLGFAALMSCGLFGLLCASLIAFG